ncbi:unnamed protein product [Rotaria sp. Silwood2]|nr:unnamed protein product [Rotaria sp. Silwood2]
MSNTDHPLMKYLMAMKDKKFQKAAYILSDMIKKIPTTNTKELVTCIKYRVSALYKAKQFEKVIDDCSKLQDLGVDIEQDPEIAMIQVESIIRITQQQSIDILENLVIKFKVKRAQELRNRLHSINPDKLFDE